MSEYVELLKRGGNAAMTINPPTGTDFHLTSRGSDWLWAAFCVFLILSLLVSGFMFFKPPTERLFYYTAIAPVVFMTINYFTLASDLGWVSVRAKYNHMKTSTQLEHPGYRQIFYTRYIGWFMAFPWPIIQASLLGNTPMWQIAFNVGLTEVFVVNFLIAGLVHSTYKWGYYSIGIAAGIIASISVMTTTRNLAKSIGTDVLKVFTIYFGVVMFLWGIYPICFGISEGGNVISTDGESIFYGVLDLILLGFLPCLFIGVGSYIGLDRLGLNSTTAGFQPLPSEKTVNSFASARNSGETAVSTPKPKAAKKTKKKSKK